MNRSTHLTAREAAQELGITLATLYSYVSRGLIRSEAGGGPARSRRYNREDVQKLKARKEGRRDPAGAVEQGLHWGAPVLASQLTLIADGRLYYRGQDALALAQRATFEEVALLLWTGEWPAHAATLFSRKDDLAPARYRQLLQDIGAISLADAFQIVLPVAATQDPARYDLRPASVAQTGGRILHLLAALAANRLVAEAGIARALQEGWLPGAPGTARLIDAALILCADHELNVSSFTARCVASAGSTPYAVVIAGLAALQGTRHGGHTARVEALLREIGTPENAPAVLASRLRRGEAIPGFGHALYPAGDPRGRLLLDLTAEAFPGAPAVALARSLEQAAFDLIAEYPTIDMALVTLARALDLPEGSPLALFALGRAAGWIAHALEQYETGQLIRPRARYTGSPPSP